MTNLKLDTILFADDQVIFAGTEDQLQRASLQLYNTMATYNLLISNTKTKVMAFIGKQPIRSKIIINNAAIEQVSHFNYLGCEVSYNKDNDVIQKLYKFQYMCGTISRTLKNKTRVDTQLKFYKTMAVPMLMYGSENWALNRSDVRKVETSEMKFLRRVAGLTLRDQVSNNEIRQTLGIYDLKEKIYTNKINWYNHIQRMDHNSITKQVLNYNPKGYRDVGRPVTRWRDSLSRNRP